MRKLLGSLTLLALFTLVSLATARADEEDTPKKGKFGKNKGIVLDKVFEKLDTNGDGKISKEEFKKFAENSAKGKGGQLGERLFDRLDTNSDGYLSKDEFKKLDELRDKIGGLKGKFGKKKENNANKEKKSDDLPGV